VDNTGNLQQLFQLGQQMQSRMSDLQRKLESETISVTSGGGMIEVAADGKGTLRSIRIDPSVVDPTDVEMLEDLILAAVSEAQRRAREKLEEEMRDATGGLHMPNLSNLLGG
jgi:DNA-binding YbaB/EbfC family protein